MSSNNQSAPVQTYWDKHDMPRLPLSQALQHIDRTIRYKCTRGVFMLVGDAGVGKTQGIHALARKHGYRVVDIRTAQFGLMSAGVPQRAEGDHFKIAVPDSMPKQGEKAIILFDEINQGGPQAMSMFFPLIEDRCLYNYQLPEDTLVIALMNPATADYSVSRIESNAALNRRLKKMYVYSTSAEWREHAKSNAFHYTDGMDKPCHPIIQRFISATPSALYDDKARSLGKQFASPATWQTVSRDFYVLESDGVKLDSDQARNLIAATIGNTMADTLIGYVAKNETLVSAYEVLTKYKMGSKIQKAILDEMDNGGGEVLRLQAEVPRDLMEEKLPPHEVAENFALFVYDLGRKSPARAQDLYSHLKLYALQGTPENPIDQATADKNREYMRELNMHLRNNPHYRATHDLFSELNAEPGDGVKDPQDD